MDSTASSKNCPKCNGSMQSGFATDRTFGALHPTGWVEGEAKNTLTVGTTLSERVIVPVVAYRCGACAFVELYAPAP